MSLFFETFFFLNQFIMETSLENAVVAIPQLHACGRLQKGLLGKG